MNPGHDAYPPGTVHIAMDESFKPLVCVGATVADSDFERVNESVATLYKELTTYSWLEDLKSFQKFAKQGFHASMDPDDVSTRFIQFLAHSYGYSTTVFFSENQNRNPNLTALILYRSMIKTLLQKYRRRPLICLYFEENEDLNRYFGGVVESALRVAGRPRPKVEVKIHPKMNPPLSAICDYTMLTFARWYIGGYRNCEARSHNVRDSTWRNLNAIRNSVSVIRSLEQGNISRRSLPFEAIPQGGTAL